MKKLVLGTETTGLEDRDQILEIAVVDYATGEVLFDQRVRPQYLRVWPGAQQVHGIAWADVVACPTFAELWHYSAETLHEELTSPHALGIYTQARHALFDLLHEAEVLIYNADFDMRMLRQSGRASGAWTEPRYNRKDGSTVFADELTDRVRVKPVCIMERAADGGRWPKLTDMAARIGYTWEGRPHSARADALAARAVALHLGM